MLGFLSPSNRGSLSTVMIILYIILGSVGGFTSSYMYKNFGGENWKLNIVLTPLFVPRYAFKTVDILFIYLFIFMKYLLIFPESIVFGVILLLNFFLIILRSSGAVPFGTLLAVVALWFLISIPLSFIGSFIGLKRPVLSIPVRTNQIPR